MSGRRKRKYYVHETYQAIGIFEVEATSKQDALDKVSEHLTTLGGHPNVDPGGGHEGEMISRQAWTESGYKKMQGEA